jgi:S-adenosyl-L-methionine hydrolase (adenosine-forming)
MANLITLTTDFGSGSAYVAAMKGMMLSENPALQLIDISHDIGPQNVRQGAVVLAEATPWFPVGTLHAAVVDPGVGTSRRMIYAKIGEQQYLAPDNGLLSLLAKRTRPTMLIELGNKALWRADVSNTFHGRDILAPVAAKLSLGLSPSELGRAIDDLQTLDWSEPKIGERRIDGIVQWVDSFGNLISNIDRNMLPKHGELQIRCAGREIRGIEQTYGNRGVGSLIALIGSGGFLELAVVNGSAAELLRVAANEPITVEW